MAKYTCECGESKHLNKTTLILVEGKWVAKEAKCSSKPAEGMPTIVRNDSGLSNHRDKLWDGAKEKLVGERGINEPFD